MKTHESAAGLIKTQSNFFNNLLNPHYDCFKSHSNRLSRLADAHSESIGGRENSYDSFISLKDFPRLFQSQWRFLCRVIENLLAELMLRHFWTFSRKYLMLKHFPPIQSHNLIRSLFCLGQSALSWQLDRQIWRIDYPQAYLLLLNELVLISEYQIIYSIWTAESTIRKESSFTIFKKSSRCRAHTRGWRGRSRGILFIH